MNSFKCSVMLLCMLLLVTYGGCRIGKESVQEAGMTFNYINRFGFLSEGEATATASLVYYNFTIVIVIMIIPVYYYRFYYFCFCFCLFIVC